MDKVQLRQWRGASDCALHASPLQASADAAVPDRVAESHETVRVSAESGENYLYPADYFARVQA